MKPVLITPALRSARWVELPEVIVISEAWLTAQGGLGNTSHAQHPIIDSEDKACPPSSPRPTGYGNATAPPAAST